MADEEGDAVFGPPLNLNPQLFVNEVLNTVDDLVDDAFNYYLQSLSFSLAASLFFVCLIYATRIYNICNKYA